jgi:hypothetical protein
VLRFHLSPLTAAISFVVEPCSASRRYTARADQAGLAKAAIGKLPDDEVG